MATKTIINLIDDLTGAPAAGTIEFSYEGTNYTIDLTDKNAARLRKTLAPYIEHGQRASRRAPAPAPDDTVAGRARIRAWAQRNGWPSVPLRGRIPAEITAAYRRAGHR
jgi:hypothetical protein